jgi:hypothetical protein
MIIDRLAPMALNDQNNIPMRIDNTFFRRSGGRMNFKTPFHYYLLLILLISLFLGGCGRVAGISATPTSSAVPATSTPQPTASFTPQPTVTPTSEPTNTLTPSPIPSPTPDREATAAAKSTTTAEAFLLMISPDLEAYGVVPSDGHVVWQQQDPIKMELTSYLENNDYILKGAEVQSDFVIQTRITWHTSGALSLCGITFRAEEDLTSGAQNKFFLMRLQHHPLWTIWRWDKGRFQGFIPGDWLLSRNIHDENGSTNVVALVVRGSDIDVFINRDKQRRVQDTKRTDGWLALSANQESGRTWCKFDKTWVWVFDE